MEAVPTHNIFRGNKFCDIFYCFIALESTDLHSLIHMSGEKGKRGRGDLSRL